MKAVVEDLGPVQKRLSVELSAHEVSMEMDSVYNRLKGEVNVRGFRKGKVPRNILERHYSPQVENEVLQKLIEKSLPKAIEKADVALVIYPRLDSTSPLKADENFFYSVFLDVWPEFETPRYKGLELERPSVEVSEEEVQGQFDALRRHFAVIESVKEERPVKKGDIVLIDYAGKIDDEYIDGLSEENYYLEVESGYLNLEFERHLLDMTKGSEKSFEIGYRDDVINSKIAGKTVNYRVLLKDIKERVLPELNDDLAQKIGGAFKTIEDVRDRLYRQLKADKQRAVKGNLTQQFLEKMMEDVDFPVPDILVENKLTQMLDNVAGHLQERGTDFDRAGLSEDRLREKMRGDAVIQVKTEMILDKIAQAEGISVDNNELSEYIERHYSQEIDKNQVQAAVLQHILPKLRAQKTMDFLLSQSIIKP